MSKWANMKLNGNAFYANSYLHQKQKYIINMNIKSCQ